MTTTPTTRLIDPFNGPVEIGLRTLVVLADAFPRSYEVQSLVVFDYLLVHSDDIEGGPPGVHPKTPHRGGELLVRREALQRGLLLFESRNLVIKVFRDDGISYSATDSAALFLDAITAPYIEKLRNRATWLIERFGEMQEEEIRELARANIDKWGAEFTSESLLWIDEQVIR